MPTDPPSGSTADDAGITTRLIRPVLTIAAVQAAVLFLFNVSDLFSSGFRPDPSCAVLDTIECSAWMTLIQSFAVAALVFWVTAGALTTVLLATDAVVDGVRRIGGRLNGSGVGGSGR